MSPESVSSVGKSETYDRSVTGGSEALAVTTTPSGSVTLNWSVAGSYTTSRPKLSRKTSAAAAPSASVTSFSLSSKVTSNAPVGDTENAASATSPVSSRRTLASVPFLKSTVIPSTELPDSSITNVTPGSPAFWYDTDPFASTNTPGVSLCGATASTGVGLRGASSFGDTTPGDVTGTEIATCTPPDPVTIETIAGSETYKPASTATRVVFCGESSVSVVAVSSKRSAVATPTTFASVSAGANLATGQSMSRESRVTSMPHAPFTALTTLL